MDKSHETPFPPFLKHTFFFLPLPVILPFYSPFLILFFHSPPHLGLLFSFLSLFPSLYFLPSFLPNIFSILPSSSFSHPSFIPNIFSYPSFLFFSHTSFLPSIFSYSFLPSFFPTKYFLLSFLPPFSPILPSFQIFSPIPSFLRFLPYFLPIASSPFSHHIPPIIFLFGPLSPIISIASLTKHCKQRF